MHKRFWISAGVVAAAALGATGVWVADRARAQVVWGGRCYTAALSHGGASLLVAEADTAAPPKESPSEPMTLTRVQLPSGGEPTVLARTADVHDLVVTPSFAFWHTQGLIVSVGSVWALSLGGGAPVEIGSTRRRLLAIAASGDRAWWLDDQGEVHTTRASNPADGALAATDARCIAADEGGAFVATPEGVAQMNDTPHPRRIAPRAFTGRCELLPAPDALYLATWSAGAKESVLERAPRAGTGELTRVRAEPALWWVVAEHTVFWLATDTAGDRTRGTVYAAPIAGGPSRVVTHADASWFDVEGDALYYVEREGPVRAVRWR